MSPLRPAVRLALCLLALVPAAIPTAGRAAQYGASYSLRSPPPQPSAGSVITVPVAVTNTGTKTWTRDPCDTKTSFYLAYHWERGVQYELADHWEKKDRIYEYEGERTPIPEEMNPGDWATFELVLKVPQDPGSYVLKLDMIEENVTWFSASADKVKTLDLPVTVGAAPAVGKVLGLAFWYSPVLSLRPEKVFVLRQGKCDVGLSFGDAESSSLEATTPGALHSYTAAGSFKVTAGDKTAGCTGTARAKLDVVRESMTCRLCGMTDCQPERPQDPVINSLSYGIAKPGFPILISGKHFGAAPGKVLAKGKFDGKAEIALELESDPIAPSGWDDSFVLARFPDGLCGSLDQTAPLRVVTAAGKVSNEKPVQFTAKPVAAVIPSALFQQECSTDVACNVCNDFKEGNCFSATLGQSVSGYHLSEAVFCTLGGGSGTDSFSATLKNGWKFKKVVLAPGSGGTFTPSGFQTGSSSISGSVAWSVGNCEEVAYGYDITAVGACGVPFQ